MEFVTDPHRDRGAAARSQPDQALAAALQRAAARRQVVPLHPASPAITAAPQIIKHRGARKRKGDYFGPFASAGAVNRTINTLQRAFLLRSCSDSVYESRTRPCLLYQIKRCSAPCTGEIALERLRRAGRRGAGASCAARARRCGRCWQRDGGGVADGWSSSAPPATATASRRSAHVTADQGINPRRRRGGRCVRRRTRKAARPASRCSSSAPARTGATAPISRRPTARCRRGGAGQLPRPVLRRQAGAAADPAVARHAESASCSPRRCPRGPGARSRSACRSAARSASSSSTRWPTRARRSAASWPKARRSATLLDGVAERVRLAAPPRAHRGVRQQPHPGHQRGGRR